MQSHLHIGRIILAVSVCVFNFVECSSCPLFLAIILSVTLLFSGWSGIKGYCLNRNEVVQQRDQLSKAIDWHHCSNITKNKDYHPCSFASQSCVLALIDGGWVSGCIADDHGYFLRYDIDSNSDQLATPHIGTYFNSVSFGSFCTTRKPGHECGTTTVIRKTTYFHPDTTVCCCKTSACTDQFLRNWSEGRKLLNAKIPTEMVSFGIVIALGVVQAVMLCTALIALIHDYYSRYRVRVVIGEAEKTK